MRQPTPSWCKVCPQPDCPEDCSDSCHDILLSHLAMKQAGLL